MTCCIVSKSITTITVSLFSPSVSIEKLKVTIEQAEPYPCIVTPNIEPSSAIALLMPQVVVEE